MTAVEYLVSTIDKKYINAFISKIVKQAKEMEKKQITDAYIEGGIKGFDLFADDYEQYYNETFKNE